MNEKTAGERKRTVTVTVGPLTEEALEGYRRHMARTTPGLYWSMTDVLGVAFRFWVREQIALGTVKLPKTWVSNLE